MKKGILAALFVYIACVGAFAGVGLASIDEKIHHAKIQAVTAVILQQNIQVLSELRI